MLHRRPAKISLFSGRLLYSLIAPSLAFALLHAAGIMGFGIDSLVIGYFLGAAQVARYSVAFSLFMVCSYTVLCTLDVAIFRTVATLYAQQNAICIRRCLSFMVRLGILYTVISGIVLWVADPWFLGLWVGYGVFPGSITFPLFIVLLAIQV